MNLNGNKTAPVKKSIFKANHNNAFTTMGASDMSAVANLLDEKQDSVIIEPKFENPEPADVLKTTQETPSGVQMISIESIIPHKYQSRKFFDESEIRELSESIRSNGVSAALKVHRIGDKFEVISGERRLRAAKLAGVSHLPCIIIESERQGILDSVLENSNRKDLDMYEQGSDFKKLVTSGVFLDYARVAEGLGVSKPTVSECVKIFDSITPKRHYEMAKLGLNSRKHFRDEIEGKKAPSLKTNSELMIQLKFKGRSIHLNSSKISTESDFEGLVNSIKSLL